VENAFGILKQTFRELLVKSDLSITFLLDVISACAILHNHLKLRRQWKVIVFHMYFVKRRVRIFNTKNLYGNDT
jgi:hypothetical protein